MAAVGKKGPRQYTVTVYPSSLDEVNSVFESIDASYPIANAFTPSSSGSAARVHWVKGSGALTDIYLNFDLSSIPLDATILNVVATTKINMTGYQSSRWAERGAFLSSGLTDKSSQNSVSTTSAVTFSDPGEWTPAELHEAKLHVHLKRSSSYVNTDYYFSIYGATLTVTYEL